MKIDTLLNVVLNDLSDLKAVNIRPLDVHQITAITDYMVIATGNSSRHVSAIADNLIRKMKTRRIDYHLETDSHAEWVLVDLGDIVVHVMQAQTREFYQLEKLWSQNTSYFPQDKLDALVV